MAPPRHCPSRGRPRPLRSESRAHLFEASILAQTADGIVGVDQHAARGRLVCECIKAALAGIERIYGRR